MSFCSKSRNGGYMFSNTCPPDTCSYRWWQDIVFRNTPATLEELMFEVYVSISVLQFSSRSSFYDPGEVRFGVGTGAVVALVKSPWNMM
ncbi:hypothetical protein AVEN_25537-1 [Araneus ventricosus]|uniref:Uncharacterized protein n=1 Tax=Araneus ventricosus TaxID=182803 RepID=A0A4Y2SP76_ARAVE|nr:hypothetical protein AVEN_25537-1 [Araneus ventricosus]